MGEEKIMSNLYCDFLYTPTGHHDQDFMVLNNYCDGKLTHIKRNEKNLIKNIFIIAHILRLPDKKTVGTASFICLFIASVLVRRWDYNLVIHFIPMNRYKFYKFLLGIFIKKCKRIFVFADCVKQNLIEECHIDNADKIFELHSRTLPLVQKNTNAKPVILIIGVLNEMKRLERLLSVVEKKHFSNLSFRFLCKGISQRIADTGFSNSCQNDVFVSDCFPTLEEYRTELYKADYSFLDYDASYGVRCSAVLLDSLGQGTPVIVNENKSFEPIVKKYGCGFAFRTEEELAKILDDINKTNISYPFINTELLDFYSETNNKKLASVLTE